MEILGTGLLGDSVLEPKQWVSGLVNNGILNFWRFSLRRGEIHEKLHQLVTCGPPWRILMAGQTGVYRC
jgi:hypothetical protein